MLWDDFQTEFLKNNYNKMTNVEISKQLNRSASSVGAKISKLKLYKGEPRSRHNQKVPGDVTINFLILRCKSAAKRRNFEFNLTKKEFTELIQNDCFYCGTKPKPYSVYVVKDQWASEETKQRSYINCNGIDRINSKLGYSTSNCRACCYKCNVAKSDLSENEFKTLIINIYNNLMKGQNDNK